LILPSYAQANPAPRLVAPSPLASTINVQALVKTTQPPDYNVDVLEPLAADQHQEALKYAAEQAVALRQVEIASEQSAKIEVAVHVQPSSPTPSYAPSYGGLGVLTGSVGYSDPDGNCVDEPGVNNPGYGNPIDWPVLYTTPHIGSTVLFVFNHTAVVVGIWSNGYVEVDQENAPGMTHTIPPSMIRGYR